MSCFKYVFVLFISLFLVGCEDLIQIDLNTANPKYVIEADINTLSNIQNIRVSQTVAFSETVGSKSINNAIVNVVDSKGKVFNFVYSDNGIYKNMNFKPEEGNTYKLNVKIDEELFTATSQMQKYVEVDSLGIVEETVFNETVYAVTLKFNDPKNINNYYQYEISRNKEKFKFNTAFSDKFNDGLYVSHELADRENSFELNDSITVIRKCIDKDVYNYWNEVQMTNPGSAAPANPTSNIDNGALGYFSVSGAKIYKFKIQSIP